MRRKIAKVAVSRAIYAIDKPYDYLVPGELEERIQPGMRVLVPFGSGAAAVTALCSPSRRRPLPDLP